MGPGAQCAQTGCWYSCGASCALNREARAPQINPEGRAIRTLAGCSLCSPHGLRLLCEWRPRGRVSAAGTLSAARTSLSPSLYPSVSLFFTFSLSVCLSLSLCLSLPPSLCVSLCVSLSPSLSLSQCLSLLSPAILSPAEGGGKPACFSRQKAPRWALCEGQSSPLSFRAHTRLPQLPELPTWSSPEGQFFHPGRAARPEPVSGADRAGGRLGKSRLMGSHSHVSAPLLNSTGWVGGGLFSVPGVGSAGGVQL